MPCVVFIHGNWTIGSVRLLQERQDRRQSEFFDEAALAKNEAPVAKFYGRTPERSKTMTK
jgi:hypothetical protein